MHLLNRIRLPMRAWRFGLAYIESFIHFDKSDSVLEIGLGDGYTSASMAKKVKMVYGYDVSKPLIQFLEQNINWPNVRFRYVDITETNCNEINQLQGSFDKIVSIETIQHVKDTEAFFKSIYKLLKPEGQAYIIFCNLVNYGISHFESNEELIEQIKKSRLQLQEFKKVTSTRWMNSLERLFISSVLNNSKRFLCKDLTGDNSHKSSVAFTNAKGEVFHQSQHFDGTRGFQIIRRNPWYRVCWNLYLEVFWYFSGLRKMFNYSERDDFRSSLVARKGHRLLLVLRKS